MMQTRTKPLRRHARVAAMWLATCGLAGVAGCQQSSPDSAPPASPAPVAAAPITPLPPAEEKRLVDMAKARRTADGVTVGEVLQYAEQQRPARFKVAMIDVDYAKDSTPIAVSVCYWIGSRRLDNDQFCKTIGWEITPDKSGLRPYSIASTQALEAGRDAFVHSVDAMYEKECAGPTKC
jgi:hypothetical protein